MNIAEAASYSNHHPMTIWRWINKGKLPAIKHDQKWDIQQSDLDRIGAEEQKAAGYDLDRLARLEHDLAIVRRDVADLKSLLEASLPPTLQRTETSIGIEPGRSSGRSGSTVTFQRENAQNRVSDAKSGLPSGLVSWRSFADLHGMAQTTVHKAIGHGRLPIVRGQWRVGKALVKEALDAPGRALFYTLWHQNPHFQACPDCPHEDVR